MTSVHPLLCWSASFDITLKCQLTRQEEHSCNTQIISSVTLDDLRDLYSSLKITLMNDVIRVILAWVSLQTGGVGFLMKDAIELLYVKSRTQSFFELEHLLLLF